MRLGTMEDIDVVVRSKKVKSHVMVVAADRVFEDGFDIKGVISFFGKKQGNLMICHKLAEHEDPRYQQHAWQANRRHANCCWVLRTLYTLLPAPVVSWSTTVRQAG